TRARPGFTASTSSVEVLWNDSVVAVVPPGNTWETYDFAVVGTGGQDRLTFREVAGQGGDGLGALYDNVALTPTSTSAAPAATLASADRSIDLMRQYTATSLVSAGSNLSSSLAGASANASVDQTLALPLH
ncbi:MAG: hypothetical protein HY852_24795, partial [Bradyrhizobium sp.]|nr:hypothetical protein [Bradyrhizobium sp.]